MWLGQGHKHVFSLHLIEVTIWGRSISRPRTSAESRVIRRVSERDPKINAQLTSVLWLGEAEGAFKVLCCGSPFSCQAAQSGGTQPSLSGLKQLSYASLYY